jgi:hypothetical protein
MSPSHHKLHEWITSVIQAHSSYSFLFNSTDFCYQNEWETKSTSPHAIQVKNWWKTISTEEKLDVTSWLENKSLTHFHNVKFNHSSICTICDNADRIKDSLKSETKVFVCIARLPQFYRNEMYKNCGCEALTFLVHQK